MRRSTLLFALLFILGVTFNAQAKTPLKLINFNVNELKNIGGHYSSIYGHVYIKVQGNYVSTNIDGKTIQLIKKSDGRFYPRYKLLKLFPISLGDMSFSMSLNKGKQQILMYPANKKNKKPNVKIVAQKFTPATVPSFWKVRLGKYKAKLLKGKSKITDIRLAIENGVLVAFINQLKNPYPLLALSSSKLTSPSAGHNKDQKIHIVSNHKNITLLYGQNSLLLNKL